MDNEQKLALIPEVIAFIYTVITSSAWTTVELKGYTLQASAYEQAFMLTLLQEMEPNAQKF